MKKVFYFGKIDFNKTGRKINLVTVEVNLKEKEDGKKVFTASANVWNIRNTDIICGGQCLDIIAPFFKRNRLYNTILDLWKRNHLNDMHAGTIEQEEAINEYLEKEHHSYEYSKICDYLKAVNLYEVEYNGSTYKYGHSWLYREISKEDLQTIETLFKEEK